MLLLFFRRFHPNPFAQPFKRRVADAVHAAPFFRRPKRIVCRPVTDDQMYADAISGYIEKTD